jgi:hypothetical protein
MPLEIFHIFLISLVKPRGIEPLTFALRVRARHGRELLRSVEPHGFVPQGSEVTEIAAGSTTKIKDGIRRVALYRVEECRVVLADIVVSRAVPESPSDLIVIRDRRV